MKQRSIIIFLLASVLVFSGMVVYGDASEVIGSVLVLSPIYWLMALGLTLVLLLLPVSYNRIVGLDMRLELNATTVSFAESTKERASKGAIVYDQS